VGRPFSFVRSGMAARKAKKVEEAPITPLKLPRGVKTLVVYGGSFDPPHVFHLNVWYPVGQVFGPWCKVLYVPAARSPHKATGPCADDHHRVEMLRVGGHVSPIQDSPVNDFGNTGIWTDEIDRARWNREHDRPHEPSYTIDTIRRLRTMVPRTTTLRLLIGSDQVLAFKNWFAWRSLIREAEPAVLLRSPAPTPKDLIKQLLDAGCSQQECLDWASRIIPFYTDTRNSTAIRNLLPLQPLSPTNWKHDLGIQRNVAKYIIKHRLYGVGTKYKPTQAPSRSAKGQRPKPRKK
jgi:nicotinate-nucleotide adenylyltransferase